MRPFFSHECLEISHSSFLITLNLLRPSYSLPTQSAWEAVCGTYDLNAVPLAPPGTRAVILDDPNKRGSWAAHGTESGLDAV
jgi:hypothetical protein